jgi:hypothetical protein
MSPSPIIATQIHVYHPSIHTRSRNAPHQGWITREHIEAELAVKHELQIRAAFLSRE